MRVARLAPDDVAVEVDGRRRAQGVELARLGRQRGREEGRDKQPDQPVRQVVQNERDEHVVRVVRRGPRPGAPQRLPCSVPGRRGPPVGLVDSGAGGGLGRAVARVPGSKPGLDMRALVRVGAREVGLEGAQPPARPVLRRVAPGGPVEEYRRALELVEDEDEHAQQKDEELHGDLEDGVEHQAEPALAQGAAAQVALDLRLVGPEIR